MTDPLADIFSLHLPSVPRSTAEEFASGMRSYHEWFKTYRDIAMNYEALPDYQNRQQAVMTVPHDQFWPYTPFFRKIVALVIQDLFKTKIMSMGTDPVSKDQSLVFVDEHANRWSLLIEECPQDKQLNRISMFFPRANTPFQLIGVQSKILQLGKPAPGCPGFALLVADVTHWNT